MYVSPHHEEFVLPAVASTGVSWFVAMVARRRRVLGLDHSAIADVKAIAVSRPSAASR